MKLGNPRPYCRGHLLRVRWGGHFTGADGPDRLVGDDHRRHRVGRDPLQGLVELTRAVLHVLTLLAEGEGLPQAQYGRQPGPQRSLHLGVDHLVGLVVVLAAFGVPGQYVVAAELGQHGPGHVPGVGARVVRGQVLRTIGDAQLVPVDQRLHAAQRGERRQHRHVDGVVVPPGQGERQLLHQRDRLEVVLVHLPVARHQRQPGSGGLGTGVHAESSSAVRPGRVLPSRYSRLAPPPVEMCPNAASSRPSARIAAAESPPPTTVSPFTPATASATARVPAAKAGNSNTPTGPFQNTVLASASFSANSARVCGPASTPSRSAGKSVTGTTECSASGAKCVAATRSTGSTSSTPRRSASSITCLTAGIWSASSTECPTS